jgi:hypothetical protein
MFLTNMNFSKSIMRQTTSHLSDLKEHNVEVLVAQCSEDKCKINF